MREETGVRSQRINQRSEKTGRTKEKTMVMGTLIEANRHLSTRDEVLGAWFVVLGLLARKNRRRRELREFGNGARGDAKKYVAVLAVLAVLHHFAGNMQCFRPPQGRQMAVLKLQDAKVRSQWSEKTGNED
jgi:hypothetical protein